MISGVLPGKFVIKTLTLSLIWYLVSVLKPLLYFRYHLMEKINNYTSSSERFFVAEIQNGTFATFFCDVFSLITITSQYLEQPWVVKILLLVFLRNIASVLSKVNKQFKNMTQAPREHGHGWHGMWENMGR